MASPRIVIVGAGPAGTRAAEALVRHGVRPVVVDEAPQSGGQIYRRQPPGFTRPPAALYGFEAAKAVRLHAAFERLAGSIDYRPQTLAWHVFEGTLHLHDTAGERFGELPFDALIITSGAADRVIAFPGWTKAGVFSLGGSQVSLKYQACAVGRRPVFLGTGPLLYLVAYQYLKAGLTPAAVLDTTPFAVKRRHAAGLLANPSAFAKGLYYLAYLRARGVVLRSGIRPERVEGEAAVEALVYRDGQGREQRIACDAVAFGYGLQSETQLAVLARAEIAYEPLSRQWLPKTDADGRSTVPGIYLAGDGARVRGADFAEAGGELAAYAALKDLARAVPEARMAALRRILARGLRVAEALQRTFPVPHHFAAELADDTVLCRCEVVTTGELRRSLTALGASEINRAKALTRVGMGRCQGRFCGLTAASVLAHAAKVPPEEVTGLRPQGPVKPVPIVPVESG
ncbi:MAG: FAD-dependent oxidoreductase [Alphaproteobacteria bacterium]